MGKTRTVATKKSTAVSSTSTATAATAPLPVLSKKKQPNVASAGLAFLVAGGYTPLVNNIQQSNNNNSNAPPLHECITTWPTRWEACQMMRDQKSMKFCENNNNFTTTMKEKSMMNANQQQQKTASWEDSASNKTGDNDDNHSEQQNSPVKEDVVDNNKKSLKSLGEAKVNVELLLKLRSWILSIVNSSSSSVVDPNSQAALRSLLMGVPISSSVLLSKTISTVVVEETIAAKNEDDDAQSTLITEQELETCDWKTLVSVAKRQISTVMDPFLEAHGMLLLTRD
jgi:hypothetical protein